MTENILGGERERNINRNQKESPLNKKSLHVLQGILECLLRNLCLYYLSASG
jgi:hypothetical protein